MTSGPSRMAAEIAEAPAAVARQDDALAEPLARLVARLRARPPRVVVTCARGSSAHAATFGKHLIERHLGLPVATAAPNVASVYKRPLDLDGQLFLAVSQSGRSDDLVAQAEAARASGAVTAALVNAVDSPLAERCAFVLPMAAGPETSVAATKTFVAAAAALLRLTARWTADAGMGAAVARLPERLRVAAGLDWSAAEDRLAQADSLVAVGRGPTLAIAREAALKLKETRNLHAEAFSGAEFRHGPIALVGAGYPVLMFMPGDEAAAGMSDLARDLRAKGAALLVAGAGAGPGEALPTLAPDRPDADALCLVQSFYAMTVRLAARLGIDVDRPRHLRKVTRTV